MIRLESLGNCTPLPVTGISRGRGTQSVCVQLQKQLPGALTALTWNGTMTPLKSAPAEPATWLPPPPDPLRTTPLCSRETRNMQSQEERNYESELLNLHCPINLCGARIQGNTETGSKHMRDIRMDRPGVEPTLTVRLLKDP